MIKSGFEDSLQLVRPWSKYPFLGTISWKEKRTKRSWQCPFEIIHSFTDVVPYVCSVYTIGQIFIYVAKVNRFHRLTNNFQC